MGVHNAATREARQLPITTAMTANLTQFTVDAANLRVQRPRPARLKRYTRRGAIVVSSFAAGAALGTWTFLLCGFWCILLPVLILGAVAIAPPPYSPIPALHRRHSRNRSGDLDSEQE